MNENPEAALPFRTVDCETANELIEALSPVNKEFAGRAVIFRGQPDWKYQLVPSVCRRGNGEVAKDSPRRVFGSSVGDQIYFEIDLLRKFLHGCDIAGLVVPGYNGQIKNELYKDAHRLISSPRAWPAEELRELLAVAQHHGIATRLLDWSKRSYVAAYFAASTTSYAGYGNERLAVWALDISYNSDWKNVAIIEPPGGTSRNLAAQAGLFTVQHIHSDSSSTFVHMPLEDEPEIYRRPNDAFHHTELLTRYSLPFYEAPNLIKLCAMFGVSGSTLFPGYEGVTREVYDWIKDQTGILYQFDPEDYIQDD